MKREPVDDRVLFVDPAPPSSLLVTADGQPVWPARTRWEREALLRIAELFGAQVIWVRGRRTRPRDGLETVVGIGPGTIRAGRLYAHLTGRRFLSERHAVTAFEHGRPAVVIVGGDRLDAGLLRLASAGPDGLPPTGIVCSADAVSLRRQVLVRAAAASMCGPVNVQRVDVRPLRPIGRMDTPGQVTVGGQAATADVVSALSCGAAVLNVFGHSDGIDALGGPVLVCARLGQPHRAAAARRPRCHLTGECHRLRLPLAEALRSPVLLSPEQLAARVLTWHTCLGVMPSNWIVDPVWGLGTRFLDSPLLGAIVTTWTIGPVREKETATLAQLLVAGHRVGDALALSQRRDLPEPTMRLCLLGDPRVRAVPSQAPHVPAWGDVPGHRLAVAAPSPRRPSPPGLDPLAGAARLLAGDENAAALRSALEAHDRTGPDTVATTILQGAILDQLTRTSWPSWSARWTQAATIVARDERPCMACAEPTNTYVGDLGSGGMRRCTICHGCNTVEDVPVGLKARLEIPRPGHARLTGWEPLGSWAASLRISTSGSWEQAWRWPATPDGTPVEQLFSPVWPAGPLRVAVILVCQRGPSVIKRLLWSSGRLSTQPRSRAKLATDYVGRP